MSRSCRASQSAPPASNSIEPWCAERLGQQLFLALNILFWLPQRRMQEAGFPPDDELFRLVCKAYESVYYLTVRVHYLSCASGVGSPRRPIQLPEDTSDSLVACPSTA